MEWEDRQFNWIWMRMSERNKWRVKMVGICQPGGLGERDSLIDNEK